MEYGLIFHVTRIGNNFGQIFHVMRIGKYYCRNMKYRIRIIIPLVMVLYFFPYCRKLLLEYVRGILKLTEHDREVLSE